MLGAFLNLDTITTWVFPILALKRGFNPHVSNFSFIWSFACNRCIVVDLSCDCEACSLDAPGVVTPDTAPDISETN